MSMSMPGVDPQRVAELQKTSMKIKAKVVVDQKTKAIQLSLSTDDPEAAALIPNMLTVLAEGMDMQFSVMFGIKVEKSKGDIKL